MPLLSSCQRLERKVLRKGLCTFCGACAGHCPYLTTYRGRIVRRDDCNLTQGRCYTSCPRVDLDLEKLSLSFFNTPYSPEGIGFSREIIFARSTIAAGRPGVQDGGVVTALVDLCLEEGLIDFAVLTDTREKVLPQAKAVRGRNELADCAGSVYGATPVIEMLNRMRAQGNQGKVGVVATPCQALALAKERSDADPHGTGMPKVWPIIGLFCTWALSPDKLAPFIAALTSGERVVRFYIPPPPEQVFIVHTASRRIVIPLDQMRELIMPGCRYCMDMTSEFADISVGAAEGMAGWNTVVVRTAEGVKLLKLARERKILEETPIPRESLVHLEEAALLKRRRALDAIVSRTGSGKRLLYLCDVPQGLASLVREGRRQE